MQRAIRRQLQFIQRQMNRCGRAYASGDLLAHRKMRILQATYNKRVRHLRKELEAQAQTEKEDEQGAAS